MEGTLCETFVYYCTPCSRQRVKGALHAMPLPCYTFCTGNWSSVRNSAGS